MTKETQVGRLLFLEMVAELAASSDEFLREFGSRVAAAGSIGGGNVRRYDDGSFHIFKAPTASADFMHFVPERRQPLWTVQPGMPATCAYLAALLGEKEWAEIEPSIAIARANLRKKIGKEIGNILLPYGDSCPLQVTIRNRDDDTEPYIIVESAKAKEATRKPYIVFLRAPGVSEFPHDGISVNEEEKVVADMVFGIVNDALGRADIFAAFQLVEGGV